MEVVSCQTLGAFLQDHILTPLGSLGMVDTIFVVPPDKHHRIAPNSLPKTPTAASLCA